MRHGRQSLLYGDSNYTDHSTHDFVHPLPVNSSVTESDGDTMVL